MSMSTTLQEALQSLGSRYEIVRYPCSHSFGSVSRGHPVDFDRPEASCPIARHDVWTDDALRRDPPGRSGACCGHSAIAAAYWLTTLAVTMGLRKLKDHLARTDHVPR
ncbi:hypothetical protein [Paraburkholderia youngii]|uniref:hypothetical protein n=1 Tax=Paraburkholderia youngii TaxID=2782701 RepID=UPI003D1BCE53